MDVGISCSKRLFLCCTFFIGGLIMFCLIQSQQSSSPLPAHTRSLSSNFRVTGQRVQGPTQGPRQGYTDHEEIQVKPEVKPRIPQKSRGGQGDFVSYIPDSPISKDLVVHRVYFDDRQRAADHKNQTVFMIDAKRKIFDKKWIVGCGIQDIRAKKFAIRIPSEWYWYGGNRLKVPFKYEHFFVDCFDLPVKDGDRAFIIYKTRENNRVVVDSAKPVFFPKPKIPSKDPEYPDTTAVTSIKANNKVAPFIAQLMHYQKAIGVDHVVMNTLSMFIRDGGLKTTLMNHSYIIPHFIDGYIRVELYKEWYDESKEAHEIRMWSESIRKVADSFHYRGTYDYIMLLDTDDFFTPRVPGKPNIKYYIEKYCSKGKIGSCILKWINYFPDFCGLKDHNPPDGNLTKQLKSFVSHTQHAPKSIHKTSVLLDATYHDARNHGRAKGLMRGYESVKVAPEICAYSHIRRFTNPPHNKC